MDLKIIGTCPQWGSSALEARLDGQLVWVWLGSISTKEGLDRARLVAQPWIGHRFDGVLPFHGICEVDNKIAWVFDSCDGRSTRSGAPTLPPLRVSVEWVGKVATVLSKLPAKPRWTSLRTQDVLVRPDGSVVIVPNVGQWSVSPQRMDKSSNNHFTWIVGLLWTQWLIHPFPKDLGSNSATRNQHLQAVLRSVTKTTNQPVPHGVRKWYIGLLAFDTGHRPMIGKIGPAMTKLNRTLEGPPGWVWMSSQLLSHQHENLNRYASTVSSLLPPLDQSPLDQEHTEHGWSAISDEITVSSGQRQTRAPVELGVIPVITGPSKEGPLPKDFFEPVSGMPESTKTITKEQVVISLTILVLALVGLILLAYLLIEKV